MEPRKFAMFGHLFIFSPAMQYVTETSVWSTSLHGEVASILPQIFEVSYAGPLTNHSRHDLHPTHCPTLYPDSFHALLSQPAYTAWHINLFELSVTLCPTHLMFHSEALCGQHISHTIKSTSIPLTS